MSINNLHSEYPTDTQIEEMWAAYELSGREGILAFLRQQTLQLQETECETPTSRLRQLTVAGTDL